MEVMSSLLLCAFLTLPQTLVTGKQIERSSNTNIKFNNTLMINNNQQKQPSRQLLLNLNAPPLVPKLNLLQEIFNDRECLVCTECMDRALQAQRHERYRVDSAELHSDLLTNTIVMRSKRHAAPTPTSGIKNEVRKEKKAKQRKMRSNKTVTVTKYNMDGEVYALKVKESFIPAGSDVPYDTLGSCLVYSVHKVTPCNALEENTVYISNTKKNVSRKGKLPKKKEKLDKKAVQLNKDVYDAKNNPIATTKNSTVLITTEKVTTTTTATLNKKQVDAERNNMQSENIMSSVEEFY